MAHAPEVGRTADHMTLAGRKYGLFRYESDPLHLPLHVGFLQETSPPLGLSR
jgi:hypothetical protein